MENKVDKTEIILIIVGFGFLGWNLFLTFAVVLNFKLHKIVREILEDLKL